MKLASAIASLELVYQALDIRGPPPPHCRARDEDFFPLSLMPHCSWSVLERSLLLRDSCQPSLQVGWRCVVPSSAPGQFPGLLPCRVGPVLTWLRMPDASSYQPAASQAPGC